MTVRGVRRLLIGALVAMASAAAAIVAFGGPDRAAGPGSPGPSSFGSSIPAPGPTSDGSPSPAPTPGPSGRATGSVGAATDAVIVRVLGNEGQPDEIEVSLVTLDAGAFETQLQPRVIARLPGSAIPEGFGLNAPAARYGQEGWLALDVAETATFAPSILIFDLRAPEAAPWLVPGRLATVSWGPGSVLAVPAEGAIQLYDPSGRTVESAPIPADVLGNFVGDAAVPPIWLADGTGFLAWRGGGEPQIGRLDLGGTFAPAAEPPAVFQSMGRERRWAADGTELTLDCPPAGASVGCRVTSGSNGQAAKVWFSEASGGGTIQDYAWDAEGNGLWFLLERVTGEGPLAYALAHADVPGDLVDVAVTSLDQPSDGGFEILGIRDAAPILDGRHVLIGPQSSSVQVAVSGDGSVAAFAPGARFAGWAADQGPYPAR